MEVRRYAEQALQPLTHRVYRRIDDEADWARVDGPDGNHDYLWQRLVMPDEGWTLLDNTIATDLHEDTVQVGVAANAWRGTVDGACDEQSMGTLVTWADVVEIIGYDPGDDPPDSFDCVNALNQAQWKWKAPQP